MILYFKQDGTLAYKEKGKDLYRGSNGVNFIRIKWSDEAPNNSFLAATVNITYPDGTMSGWQIMNNVDGNDYFYRLKGKDLEIEGKAKINIKIRDTRTDNELVSEEVFIYIKPGVLAQFEYTPEEHVSSVLNALSILDNRTIKKYNLDFIDNEPVDYVVDGYKTANTLYENAFFQVRRGWVEAGELYTDPTLKETKGDVLVVGFKKEDDYIQTELFIESGFIHTRRIAFKMNDSEKVLDWTVVDAGVFQCVIKGAELIDLCKKIKTNETNIETNRINIDTKAKDFTIDNEYLKFDVNRELTLSDRHRKYIYDDISEAMETSKNSAIRDAKEYTDAEITGAKSYADEKAKKISITSGTTQTPLKAVEYSIGNYGGGYISFDTTKDTLKIRFLTVERGSRTFDTISLIEKSYMDDFVEGVSRDLDAMYSKIDQISSPDLFKIVTALPTIGEENRFYFILSDDPETKNMYDEYIWVDNAWELVGTQKLDEVNLENYYNKQQVDTKLETKATQQDIESAIQSAIFDSWQGEV